MLQQRLNALIKARVPTTIWFLSLMSPLRKSTKIRKKVASLIPMIPTKWYGNHMACSTDRRIWKCPCKLFSFFNFLAANLTLKGAIFTEQRNRWYSHRKWHSDDETLTEKQSLLQGKKKQNKTKHNTSPTPSQKCFWRSELRKYFFKE